MQRHDENLITPGASGNLLPLSGVTVTVTSKATGLPATVYADDEVTALTSIVTDDNGYYYFRAPDGVYVVTYTSPRIATYTREVVLEDPTDDPYVTASQLAALDGATRIGYQRPFDGAFRTVAQAIDEATASNSATILGTVLAGLSTATNAVITATDTVLSAPGKLQKQITDWIAKKDATGGYAGLTGFSLNLKNAAGTILSTMVSAATVARTWTFPDKDGTVAMLGDITNPGMVLLSTSTISSPVASANFLTSFTSTYDQYHVELSGLVLSTGSILGLRAAQAGAAITSSSYLSTSSGASSATISTGAAAQINLGGTGTIGATMSLDFRNMNEAGDITRPKAIEARGNALTATQVSFVLNESIVNATGALSGFQIFPASGNITAGTVRVYGIMN